MENINKEVLIKKETHAEDVNFERDFRGKFIRNIRLTETV